LLNRSVREVAPGVSENVDYRELQRKILSTDYLLQVVQRLDLFKDENARATASAMQASNSAVPFDELLQRVIVGNLRSIISVNVTTGSKLFQITCRNPNPEAAYWIAKTLTDIFIDESKKNELRGIRGVREFSNEQLAIYQQKVDEAQENLRQFKAKLASSQAQNLGTNSENIVRLRELITSSDLAISDRQRRLAEREQRLPASTTQALWNNDPELARVKAQINVKLDEFKKAVRITGLGGSYEMALNNDLVSLRQDCQRLLTGLIARLYPQLTVEEQQMLLEYQLEQSDLYILRVRATIANEVLNGFVNMAAAQPADQLELQRLQDEVDKNRRVYDVFFEQSRGTQIEEALQNTDANFKYLLIEPARIPITPVAGSKINFVAWGFLISLVIGIAAIFGLEMLDQSIRTVEDVEQYLQLPVWGIIPRVSVPFKTWHNNLKKVSEVQERRNGAPASPAPDASVKKTWTI
jgi:capsular polysaccharide biosynthesis protein